MLGITFVDAAEFEKQAKEDKKHKKEKHKKKVCQVHYPRPLCEHAHPRTRRRKESTRQQNPAARQGVCL